MKYFIHVADALRIEQITKYDLPKLLQVSEKMDLLEFVSANKFLNRDEEKEFIENLTKFYQTDTKPKWTMKPSKVDKSTKNLYVKGFWEKLSGFLSKELIQRPMVIKPEFKLGVFSASKRAALLNVIKDKWNVLMFEECMKRSRLEKIKPA